MSDIEQLVKDMTEKVAQAHAERLEMVVKGAILAEFDGVDINYDPLTHKIVGSEPWNYPAPDSDNGYRTERYTWDWFDQDELVEMVQNDELIQGQLDDRS